MLILGACSDGDSDKLALAEEEYDAGRFESAKKLAEELSSDARIDTTDVRRLCRLSILSVKLAEQFDEQSNLANAMRCMQTAISRNPDTVEAFIESLTIEDRTRSAMISQLMQSMGQASDSLTISDYEENGQP